MTRLCLVTGCPRSGTRAVARWLGTQRDTVTFLESRVLVAAHGFLREVHRFAKLDRNKDPLTDAIRRVVATHYAEKAMISRDLIVEKEPLEPIAFPERDYSAFLSSVTAMYPHRIVLFMMRHPIGVVWSQLQRQWGLSLTHKQPRERSLEEAVEIWKENARIATGLKSDERSMVCRLEDLVESPARMSAEIGSLLGMARLRPFRPRKQAVPGFGRTDRHYILSATEEERSEWGY